MGLYDFLVEHNMSFDRLIRIVYDLSKFIYIGDVRNTVKWLDDIYDDKEFKEFKKQTKNNNKN